MKIRPIFNIQKILDEQKTFLHKKTKHKNCLKKTKRKNFIKKFLYKQYLKQISKEIFYNNFFFKKIPSEISDDDNFEELLSSEISDYDNFEGSEISDYDNFEELEISDDFFKGKKHQNNKIIEQMFNTNKNNYFYLNCEKCENKISVKTIIYPVKTINCEEFCNGCSSIICYECIPHIERFNEINLESKDISIRDPLDRRCNTTITIDKVNKKRNDYCIDCAFKKLKSGICIKNKE